LPTPCPSASDGTRCGLASRASILARKREGDAPHFVYTPERPFDVEEFLTRVDRLLSRQGWVMGVVAEAVRDRAGRVVFGIGRSELRFVGTSPGLDVAIYLAALVSKRLKGARAQ